MLPNSPKDSSGLEGGHAEVGYLSDDARLIELELKAALPLQVSLFGAINRLGMMILSDLERTDTDLKEVHSFVATGIYAIVLRRCQAAYIVSLQGLSAEADALSRCGLEALFFLGAFLKDPSGTLAAIDAGSIHDSITMANALVAQQASVPHIGPERMAGVAARKVELQALEAARLNVETFAIRAGMSNLYLLLYRSMSVASVHLTARTIDRHLTINETSRVIEFGPDDAEAVRLTLLNAATILINSFFPVVERFGLIKRAPRLAELSTELLALGNAVSGPAHPPHTA